MVPGRAILAAVVAFPILIASSPTLAEHGPGWPTVPLLQRLAQLLDVEEVDLEDQPELPRGFLIDPTEEAACFRAPGENVRLFKAGEHSSGVLVGDETHTHTLYFYYPVLNDSKQAARGFYAEMFEHLLPDWEGAATWYTDSLREAWEATGRAMIDPSVSYNETIARHAEGDVHLATFGVPPDIIFYRVTSRPECEKVSPFLLASPREVPKGQAQRQTTQELGQLLLNYVHPMPVDVSATPILLGTAYANNRHGERRPTLRFDPPGVEADMRDWIDQQVATDRYASTLEAISADWGYTSHFIHLIEQPRLPVEADGEAYLLVVEKLTSAVLGPLANGLSFAPMNAEALVFAAEMPPLLPETPVPSDTFFAGSDIVDYGNRLPELPEAAQSCGIEIPCGQRPFYLATDVSDTPVHLGGLYLYFGGHSGDRPGYYEVRVEGMTVVATDRESGEEAVLDLAAWARAQGNFDGPAGGRVFKSPKLAFELGGKRHVLVIQGTTLNREKGKVESLSGQLFTTH